MIGVNGLRWQENLIGWLTRFIDVYLINYRKHYEFARNKKMEVPVMTDVVFPKVRAEVDNETREFFPLVPYALRVDSLAMSEFLKTNYIIARNSHTDDFVQRTLSHHPKALETA